VTPSPTSDGAVVPGGYTIEIPSHCEPTRQGKPRQLPGASCTSLVEAPPLVGAKADLLAWLDTL
jgi:hypothetical protein